ncbi:hypothetical protein K9L16_00750 [Candidatus Pacearchaeota archaeon]|nr:hypothetical protein [Candidatus Pacearchaeota archaeon]
MAKNKIAWVIGSLLVIIIVLLGIVIYTLVIRPNFNDYVLEKQMETYNQGVSDTIGYIVSEINQRGYSQISVGNQTLILVPGQFNPSQTTSQTQETQE